MMILQHIYLCSYIYQKGVTNSYVHIWDFEDYTEQKKTRIFDSKLQNF
jgi:hypothetical protein